ncbi:hypothetical protein D3C84_1226870 [compost metagenome]
MLGLFLALANLLAKLGILVALFQELSGKLVGLLHPGLQLGGLVMSACLFCR